MRAAGVFFALVFAASGAAGQPEHPLAKDHPGAWRSGPPVKPDVSRAVAGDERAAAVAWVNELVELMHRTATLAPQAGFEVVPHANIALENLDRSDSKRPAYVTAGIVLNLAPYEKTARGVEGNERDSAITLQIKVNDVSPVGGTQMTFGDAEGHFIQDPSVESGTAHGLPVFEEGNGDKWVIVRRNDAPFYAPVSRERYLRVLAQKTEEEVNTLQARRARVVAFVPAQAQALDDHIADLQKKLADTKQALASVDRSAPADVDGTPVFYINPALMDSRLPRSAPQIVAVSIRANEDLFPGLADAIDKEIDWAALKAFVSRK